MQGLERAGGDRSSRLPLDKADEPGWRRTVRPEPDRSACQPHAGAPLEQSRRNARSGPCPEWKPVSRRRLRSNEHSERLNESLESENALGLRDASALCDGVVDLMAALFSVSGRQLRSPKRHGRPVARVRQIGMYIAHTSLGLRMAEVAAGFGRDKSTVMYACHLVEDLRDDVDFDRIVAQAEQIVRVAFDLRTVREGDNDR